MTLQQTIEHAAAIAYEEDADQYVICEGGDWRIVHHEDPAVFAPGTGARFLVHSDGVDAGHIARGEITEDGEIPS